MDLDIDHGDQFLVDVHLVALLLLLTDTDVVLNLFSKSYFLFLIKYFKKKREESREGHVKNA